MERRRLSADGLHAVDWQDPTAAREGPTVRARDSAHGKAVAHAVSKWLRAPVAEAPKYRREARPNTLSAFEAALKQALTADARRPKHE